MARHRRKCLPDPDVTVMCITLQRKRRESASSSSSVKKVKKPWWGQEHQLVHGRGQGAVWVTVFTAEIPKVLGLDKKDTGEQDAIILSIYVEAPLTTHTHIHTFFNYQWDLSNPSSSPPNIFVTKATTEWHFIPLLLDSLPPPSLSLRWGKINCKLPGWANRDMWKKVGMTA